MLRFPQHDRDRDASLSMTDLKHNLKKAAPRFELGVEVLQTSALPLGYAAVTSEI
jgi:hypothetical protein